MKRKAFFIIFKRLPLNKNKTILLEGEKFIFKLVPLLVTLIQLHLLCKGLLLKKN